MRLVITLALLACAHHAQAQTIYKCTSASGAVTMQQTPCDRASVSSATIQAARPAPPAAARPDARVPGQQTAAEPRKHWIVWSGEPRSDMMKANANLESIQLLGQTCELALRTRGENLSDCQKFLAQLAPGGDFGRIGDKVQEILRDGSAAQQVPRSEFVRSQQLARDVGRIKEFVLVALRQ
jgi:hypothetical protein